MKMSNAEVMKKISLLNDEKNMLRSRENLTYNIEYTTKEDRAQAIENSDYNYVETTKRISEIDSEVLKLKGVLAQANATVIVSEYNMTIGQCLVKLGQLNESIARYESLRCAKQKSSSITSNGIVTYVETLYDVKEVQKQYSKLLEEKASLQVALDKVNLLNEIEL